MGWRADRTDRTISSSAAAVRVPTNQGNLLPPFFRLGAWPTPRRQWWDSARAGKPDSAERAVLATGFYNMIFREVLDAELFVAGNLGFLPSIETSLRLDCCASLLGFLF